MNRARFFRKGCITLIAITALLGALLGAWTIPVSAQADDCVKIKGTWINFETAGDIVGVFSAENVVETITEDGTIHYAGLHILETPNGTIFAVMKGVASPVNETDYHVTEHNTIVGGTGDYEGATGRYLLQGIFNAVTGSGVYRGRICFED